jgi:hypothetical protein
MFASTIKRALPEPAEIKIPNHHVLVERATLQSPTYRSFEFLGEAHRLLERRSRDRDEEADRPTVTLDGHHLTTREVVGGAIAKLPRSNPLHRASGLGHPLVTMSVARQAVWSD